MDRVAAPFLEIGFSCFDTNGSATRTQVAVIFSRYVELPAQGGISPGPAPAAAL